ncbi:MAG: hypothetical protein R3E18_13700, partial [Sphingomonadaceae bacterium]
MFRLALPQWPGWREGWMRWSGCAAGAAASCLRVNPKAAENAAAQEKRDLEFPAFAGTGKGQD